MRLGSGQAVVGRLGGEGWARPRGSLGARRAGRVWTARVVSSVVMCAWWHRGVEEPSQFCAGDLGQVLSLTKSRTCNKQFGRGPRFFEENMCLILGE